MNLRTVASAIAAVAEKPEDVSDDLIELCECDEGEEESGEEDV